MFVNACRRTVSFLSVYELFHETRCHGAQDSDLNSGKDIVPSFRKRRDFLTESHCMMPIIR